MLVPTTNPKLHPIYTVLIFLQNPPIIISPKRNKQSFTKDRQTAVTVHSLWNLLVHSVINNNNNQKDVVLMWMMFILSNVLDTLTSQYEWLLVYLGNKVMFIHNMHQYFPESVYISIQMVAALELLLYAIHLHKEDKAKYQWCLCLCTGTFSELNVRLTVLIRDEMKQCCRLERQCSKIRFNY